MKLVTAAELAELAGKSRQSVFKNKYLPYTEKNGMREYDLNDSTIKKWLNGESLKPAKKPVKKKLVKKTVKKKILKKKLKKKVVKKKSVKKKTLRKHVKKIDLSGFEIDEHLKKLTDSGELSFAAAMGLTKRDLDKIKIYEQIKDIKGKADERREGLVSRKLVRTVFSKIYEIDMNQLIPMKEKLIPDIAAIFETKNQASILKAGKKLDTELWKILGNIKRELNKFLNKVGEDQI